VVGDWFLLLTIISPRPVIAPNVCKNDKYVSVFRSDVTGSRTAASTLFSSTKVADSMPLADAGDDRCKRTSERIRKVLDVTFVSRGLIELVEHWQSYTYFIGENAQTFASRRSTKTVPVNDAATSCMMFGLAGLLSCCIVERPK
jgi:hypothetical protein